jgi:hyperosmotically inducible protein
MNSKWRNRWCACLLVAPGILLTGALSGCALTRNDDVRTTGEYIDDRSLVNRVEDALKDDPVYKFYEVDVAALKGTVQLSGFVMTEDQRQRAETIASSVPGAVAVENKISVRRVGAL